MYKLSAITSNYVQLLNDIECTIIHNKVLLSSEECELLVEQLGTLKKELCTQPNAGFLVLPLMASLLYGAKTWLDYCEIKAWQDATLVQELFLDRGKQADVCMHDLFHFIICLSATFVINLEYRESVAHFFKKERILERKINKLITILKTA